MIHCVLWSDDKEDRTGDQSGAERIDPESATDSDLICGIAKGCEESFLALFRRWVPRLGPFLASATGSRETAEDLLQETFLRVFRAAPSFEPRGSARAWLYRIAVNLVYSHWRREMVRPLRAAQGGNVLAEVRAPAGASPEDVRLRHAFLSDAAEALRRMDAVKRMVFLMKVGQGLTYEEIAVVLCCPPGTVKSRFHHALRSLRRELGKRDWDAGAGMAWHTGGSDVE